MKYIYVIGAWAIVIFLWPFTFLGFKFPQRWVNCLALRFKKRYLR